MLSLAPSRSSGRATSMNEAGSTEIVEIEDAADFCRRHGLPLLFESSAPHNASGSLPILEFPPLQVPPGLLDDLTPAAATRSLLGLLYPAAK
jgi:hypothetical protein